MESLNYEARLRALKLTSLEYRRIRGDIIEVKKSLKNIYDPITTKSLLTINRNNTTRGHNFKLKIFHSKLTNSNTFSLTEL